MPRNRLYSFLADAILLNDCVLGLLMDFHATLAQLTRHPSFKAWHAKNKDYFLAHAFVLFDEANKDLWQIGFYHAKNEKMITFIVSPDKVEHTEEQDVLKSTIALEKLEPDKVTIPIDDALKTAHELFTKDYRAEKSIKQFFIIQTIEAKPVFNITYFTQSFKTVNIKIDAANGKLIKADLQNLAEFG